MRYTIINMVIGDNTKHKTEKKIIIFFKIRRFDVQIKVEFVRKNPSQSVSVRVFKMLKYLRMT